MEFIGKIQEVIPKLFELDSNKIYKFEIKEPKSKRSIQQNRYMWKLIREIAKTTGNDENDVYCELIERTDAKSDYVMTAFDLENELKKSFRAVKFIQKRFENGKERFVYKVYVGSSQFDVKEMNELLEITLNVAHQLGIQTYEIDY